MVITHTYTLIMYIYIYTQICITGCMGLSGPDLYVNSLEPYISPYELWYVCMNNYTHTHESWRFLASYNPCVHLHLHARTCIDDQSGRWCSCSTAKLQGCGDCGTVDWDLRSIMWVNMCWRRWQRDNDPLIELDKMDRTKQGCTVACLKLPVIVAGHCPCWCGHVVESQISNQD